MNRTPYIMAVAISVASATFLSDVAASSRNDSIVNPLEELVVTGSNKEIDSRLLPFTVSVVKNREIEASAQPQLLKALSGMVPSLFVTGRNILGFGVSNNGGSGGMTIRGVGGGNAGAVLMLLDGQPQFAGIYSHHVADVYESDYVERVEVLRGPGSLLYGSNAMGGAINVITKNATEDGVHGVLSTQYGSYNTWESSLTATARYGKFSAMVNAGYDRSDGIKKNFDFKQSSAYAKVGYDISDHWKVKADYSVMQFVGNDPVYPRLKDPESMDIYHQNVVRGEGALTLSDSYKNTDGVLRVYYSYGNHFVRDPRSFHSLDDRFGILAYQNVSLWEGAASTIGFDFDIYSGQIPLSGGSSHKPGSMSTIDRKSIAEYSPYVTLQQMLWSDRIVLNAGIRMANSDMFGTHWIPQGGFSVNPWKDVVVKASVAKGYRNPSFKELYLYRMANPDLRPESMMNYEVGVSKGFSRWINADLVLYFAKGDNIIETVAMKNCNTGSFINKGIEVSLSSNPLPTLHLRASYSYMHTTLRNLTAAPKNQYYLSASWDAFKGFRADVQLKGVGGLYVADDVAHQNYVTLDMKLSYKIFRWMQVYVKMDNITDSRYQIMRGYEMPGITILGGLKFSI